MAKSRYEYVKFFEKDDSLLPNTWIVVRIDGRGFHGFSKAHNFHKPNDIDALNLMNTAAKHVMRELTTDIVLAYGDSDEYSFLFTRDCMLYKRREFKIVSAIVSLFTSSYIYHWKDHFPNTSLKYPPSFDGRAVLYPDIKNVRDYFAWRQADCHINNLHNTVFWSLVHEGMTENEATKRLEGTEAADKNEILWADFGINYNKEPAIFRKGTILYREEVVRAHLHDHPDGDTVLAAPFPDTQTKQQTPSQSETGPDPTISSPQIAIQCASPESSQTLAIRDNAVPKSSIPSSSKTASAASPPQKKPKTKKRSKKLVIKEDYVDIIRDDFWDSKSWILA